MEGRLLIVFDEIEEQAIQIDDSRFEPSLAQKGREGQHAQLGTCGRVGASYDIGVDEVRDGQGGN